ncbi:immunoglobulin superfamily member 3-like [Pseudorasbora parva]|uniref:immunoglobulin superfamily member 3-like n=1 Tax=Pseudorasbora parva TaxID=51549 RepID=UPI00351EA2AD
MLLLVFIISSLLRENAAADVITPLLTEKHVLEGKDVTLICNYTGQVDNLQWYRQYPGSKPEHLILFFETKSSSSLRLTAAADKAVKHMNLTISSTEVSDSAMYYCALVPTVTGNTTAHYKNSEKLVLRQKIMMHNETTGYGIKSDNNTAELMENENLTLSCTYEGSVDSLHWYQQKPGSRSEFLIMIDEASEYVAKASRLNPRVSIKLQKAHKRVYLQISSTAVMDSAVYYCALRPTVTGNTHTLYKNPSTVHNHSERPCTCKLVFLFCDAVFCHIRN